MGRADALKCKRRGAPQRKSFAVRYRPKGSGAGGPKRFAAIGGYGVLTAEEARGRAKEIPGVVAMGGDPAADIAEKRAA